ncbi:hypothetical protein HGM15179_020356 [Zosterops borbonicus]|uniref:RNase H type-1 domain-containing protein n=1 Tax=Zosterops borbonicus TaxID=364589 RepID=A0A8K1D6H4_9PASS|nr:hypothetical protein HGM15179_020356 [Zosterops borbonicus]
MSTGSGSYCAIDTRSQEAHDGKTHRCLRAAYGDHGFGAKGGPLALSKQDDEIPGTTAEEGPLEHDCMEVIEHTYAARADLKDVPLEQPEWELFTDGSSFMENGIRYAGYAVTTVNRVVEAKALPPSTSAQRAELVALTRALELSEGKMVNIWTDSKYAFGVVHVHDALWKERGLSSQGTRIKHQDAVLQLINAVQKPEQVVIMHCKAHQPGNSRICEGNRKADWTARQVVREAQTTMALIPLKFNVSQFNLPPQPKYRAEDNRLEARKNPEGWYVTAQGQIVVPPLMQTMAKSIMSKCEICLKNKPVARRQARLGRIRIGIEPGDYWQVDFA